MHGKIGAGTGLVQKIKLTRSVEGDHVHPVTVTRDDNGTMLGLGFAGGLRFGDDTADALAQPKTRWRR